MVTPPPIETANIGMADSLIIMVLALVVFGPRKLPQIGRQIGKLMYEFRKASNDFKFQMEEELRNSEEADRRKREEAERQQRLALAAQSTAAGSQESAAPDQSGQIQSGQIQPGPVETNQNETSQAETSQAASSQAALPEPSYPRIQPPSTGEQVATARPGSVTSEPVAPAEQAQPTEPDSGEKSTAADEHSAVTEQASHNG
jgi:sec-independent protein translocase protein TatB